jgi:hypothetical protein
MNDKGQLGSAIEVIKVIIILLLGYVIVNAISQLIH